jgi:hypothetical protein
MNQKQLLSAEELEALLARPAHADLNPDNFFPLRLWVIGFAGFFWFIRLTVFTDQVANGLFADPLVREYMKTALYFRAWIMFAFMFMGFIAYSNGKYPALFFLGMFIVSAVNFVADMTIFYKDQFANPSLGFNLLLLFRLSMCYLLFVSIRNAKRIPAGKDKWNPFLIFQK